MKSTLTATGQFTKKAVAATGTSQANTGTFDYQAFGHIFRSTLGAFYVNLYSGQYGYLFFNAVAVPMYYIQARWYDPASGTGSGGILLGMRVAIRICTGMWGMNRSGGWIRVAILPSLLCSVQLRASVVQLVWEFWLMIAVTVKPERAFWLALPVTQRLNYLLQQLASAVFFVISIIYFLKVVSLCLSRNLR